jgi:hypothetical protein
MAKVTDASGISDQNRLQRPRHNGVSRADHLAGVVLVHPHHQTSPYEETP